MFTLTNLSERYQDLIAAADTISSMKTCAMSLSEHFDAVEKASTIFSTKVEGLKNAPKDPEAAATGTRNLTPSTLHQSHMSNSFCIFQRRTIRLFMPWLLS